MKIAILGIKGIPGHHGVEVVVDSLVPYLASMGHDITVYGYDSYTKSTDGYRGVKIKAVSGSSRSNIEMISHMWMQDVNLLIWCIYIVLIPVYWRGFRKLEMGL